MIFAPKDTLSLMPTFLGRTMQARGEEFVEKLLGGSDRTTIDMATPFYVQERLRSADTNLKGMRQYQK